MVSGAQLVSVDGETTSHLMGTFYRTIRLVENGIKPVYVFDGKPPDLKAHQLTKRAERREEAEKELQKATEAGKVVLYKGHAWLFGLRDMTVTVIKPAQCLDGRQEDTKIYSVR